MVKYLKGDRLGFWVKYQLFLDVIWLDNLIVNFIVLYITWKLSGNTGSLLRLWCSAGIGAFYAVLLILPGFSFLSWLPFKILLSLIMLLPVSPWLERRRLFRSQAKVLNTVIFTAPPVLGGRLRPLLFPRHRLR